MRQCPECQSNHINKNGHKKGKQNYICVNCGRQFIEVYEPQ
ncbi:MAG: IS1 family transposase, partial [Microcystis aeruginosa LG13-03]|nr:IS1 family transposase [Microcystis aeruginosa LG13-13]NCR05588.1 IS1 family transposase [Microcystis aeruginosa LG13-03]NCR63849.1 IS1 family transposase [Microcystis aeruginosa LG11-05]NCR72544.1 IS1 family transposase [Microcystis aeruginosa LG13-12]